MTKTRAVKASSISQYLRDSGWHRYNGNDTRGGFRALGWTETYADGPTVKVEYNGVRKDMGIGRFSDSAIRERGRETLVRLRKELENGGYHVGWGWVPETGEVDTSFLVITAASRLEGRPVSDPNDPYSDARQLMGWTENYLVQAKYLKSGSDPAAPYFGFDVKGSINGWGETHVTVQYRPGQFEEYDAVLQTVQAYAKVLSAEGLATIVRTLGGHPVCFVAEDATTLLKVVARQDKAEETSRRHAEEAEAEYEHENEEAMAESAGRLLRSLLITVPQVDLAVREVQDLVGEGKLDEARRLEAQTYRSVLMAVVGNADDLQALAAAALETQHLSFRR